MKKYFTSFVILLILEIVTILFIVIGIFPREVSLFLTGILLFYFIFSPLEDSLVLLIASIPLFIALPITESFDSMASWRILIAAVFLVWFLKSFKPLILPYAKKFCCWFHSPIRAVEPKCESHFYKWLHRAIATMEPTKNSLARFFFFSFLFLLVGFLSLIQAFDITVGIKKILFLGNIFLLFVLIVNIVKTRESILRIIKAAAVACGITIAVGFVQLFAVLKLPLYAFWQFWAENVSGAFYGNALANLLSYSNTWFSYYNAAPPTLRLFSIMPDSHSFAMIAILSAPLFLALAFHYKQKKRIKKIFLFFLSLSILSIVLSGSRGAWLAIIFPLIILSFLFYRQKQTKRKLTKTNWVAESKDSQQHSLEQGLQTTRLGRAIRLDKKLTKTVFISIGLFFLMFIASSFYPPVLYKFQSMQTGSDVDFESFSFFKRAKSISDITEISNKGRLEIWGRTLNSISERPLLGVGIGNFPVVLDEDVSNVKRGASAHNLYLDIFSEMGIFGLLIFLLLILEILRVSYSVFKKSQDNLFKLFALSFGCYAIWIFGYSFFDVTLFNDKVLMLFMAEVGILYVMDFSA